MNNTEFLKWVETLPGNAQFINKGGTMSHSYSE